MRKLKIVAASLLLTLMMASPSRAVLTVLKNFNASSQAPSGRSAIMRFTPGESFSYTAIGTFTQVLNLEQSFNGTDWRSIVLVTTIPAAGTIGADNFGTGPNGVVFYSWRCSSFTSGTSTVTITTADNLVFAYRNHRGAVPVQINDESLMVNGALKLTPSSAPPVALGVFYFDAGQNKFLGSTDGATYSNIGSTASGGGGGGGAPTGAAGGNLAGSYPNPSIAASTITNASMASGAFAAITGIGAQAQALNMNSNLINNVTNPVSAQDAATKNYVDTSTGTKVLPTKIPARVATTAALPANVYANGSSGVGATLTGAGLGTFAVDGVTPSPGDRILVNNEATAANNGIYLVSVNAAGAFYILTRAVDFDSVSEMGAGEAVVIATGTVNSDAFFALIASVTTVGTSPINFVKVQASFTGGSVANATQFVSSVTYYGDSQSIMSTDTFNAAQTINWQQRNRKFIQLYGNVISSVFNNMADGGYYELILCQDAAGSRTFAWPAGTVFPNRGSAPVLTTTANRCDMFTMQFLSFDGNAHVVGEALNN